MKKVLSLVLVIAMVLSSMSFAFASNFEDVADSDYAKAIDTLTALGVINGFEDGTFRPEAVLTRAQLAKLLVVALGYEDLVGGESNFSDMKGHWADGHVAIATGIGLVQGMGDGTFAPDAAVTYDQALTMVIRALGYTDASLKGTWPTNFKIKALDLGLTKDLAKTAGNADRGGVAQIIYNALSQKTVTVDADNKITDKDELIAKLGAEKTYQVVPEMLDTEDTSYKGDLVDLTPYMYQNVTAYENKDKEVVFVRKSNSLVVEGEVKGTPGSTVVVTIDKTDYTFDVVTGSAICINSEELGSFTGLADKDKVKVVLDAKNDAKLAKTGLDIVGVVARKATQTVQLTQAYKAKATTLNAGVVVLPKNDDNKVDFDKLVVTGDAEALEDLAKNDVLTLYYGKNLKDADNKLEIVVSRDVVEGKVTKKSGSEYTVNGKVYKSAIVLTVGNEYKLYLDAAGKIQFSSAISVDANEYAVLVKLEDGYKANNSTSGAVLLDAKITLVNASNEKVTYVLDDQEAGSIVDITDKLVATTTGGTINGKVIKYNVNSDGKVDKVESANASSKVTGLFTTGNSFVLADNAVIYDIKDPAKPKVISVSQLGKKVDGYVVTTNGEIVVLAIDNLGVETDKTYAVMTGNTNIVLNNDDKKVIEYTAFVDGVEMTYLDTDETAASYTNVSGDLVELNLKGTELTSASAITTSAGLVVVRHETADEVFETYVTVSGSGANVYLSDDVVVYVYEDGEVTVGTIADIEGEFYAYNLDKDESNEYSIVIVRK